MGAHASQDFFKILKSISKSPKSPKLALVTKILKKILKTAHKWTGPGAPDPASETPWCARRWWRARSSVIATAFLKTNPIPVTPAKKTTPRFLSCRNHRVVAIHCFCRRAKRGCRGSWPRPRCHNRSGEQKAHFCEFC